MSGAALFGVSSTDEQMFDGLLNSSRINKHITICEENLDVSREASCISIVEPASPQQPYAKTIDHMKQLLAKKSAPMQKILDLNQNRTILTEEIYLF